MGLAIRHLLVGASPRDAITNIALSIAEHLEDLGTCSVHSYFLPDESLEGRVRRFDDLGLGSHRDVLIYHLSYGIPHLTEFLLTRPERLIVVYHNITPAEIYVEQNHEFALGLHWGRYELERLARRAEIGIAMSKFSERDLIGAGYRKTVSVPIGVDPSRLVTYMLDPGIADELANWATDGFVLFVSQLLRHKRVDLAIAAVHYARATSGLDLGLVVVGSQRDGEYFRSVREFADSLPDSKVKFLHDISHSSLATLYRTCTLYLNTSDHEGLAVPPLEAMACGAPVMVRNSGAMGETVGEGGIVVPSDVKIAELAELIIETKSNPALRSNLRMRGYEQAAKFEARSTLLELRNVVEELL